VIGVVVPVSFNPENSQEFSAFQADDLQNNENQPFVNFNDKYELNFMAQK
jgi:hypothetical protein